MAAFMKPWLEGRISEGCWKDDWIMDSQLAYSFLLQKERMALDVSSYWGRGGRMLAR